MKIITGHFILIRSDLYLEKGRPSRNNKECPRVANLAARHFIIAKSYFKVRHTFRATRGRDKTVPGWSLAGELSEIDGAPASYYKVRFESNTVSRSSGTSCAQLTQYYSDKVTVGATLCARVNGDDDVAK